MIPAGVHDAQRITGGRKVELHRMHHRLYRIRKVDGNCAAHRRRHLIHQTAGLMEIDVFRILSHLRQLHRSEPVVGVQGVADIPQQHLKCRRRGQPRTRHDLGCGIRIKAGIQRTSVLLEPGSCTTDKLGCGGFLVCHRLQLIQRDHICRKALGLHADSPVGAACHNGDHIQVDACRQHMTTLVVGVVAAQFCPSRRRKNGDLPVAAEMLCKCINGTQQTCPICFCQICAAAQQHCGFCKRLRAEQPACFVNRFQCHAPFYGSPALHFCTVPNCCSRSLFCPPGKSAGCRTRSYNTPLFSIADFPQICKLCLRFFTQQNRI